MHVAVVIVGFRNVSDITHCLAALARSRHADFEVVICENGGPDAFAALQAAAPDRLPGGQPVELICAPGNLGFAGGMNVGIRARPDADAWWLLNPDAEPDPDALGCLVQRLERGDCAAVGGMLYGHDGLVQSCGGRWRGWLARAEVLGRGGGVDDPLDADALEARLDYISGASLLAGRSMLEQAGLMRDDYFLYAEEVEWCVRAKAKGLKLGFAPGSRVLHSQGATTGSADAHARRPRLPIYMDERNKLHVVRDTTPWRLPVAIVASLVLAFLRFGRRGAWRQQRDALAGWWAGIRGERGAPAWLG